jgi:hypothetical protein
VAEKRGRGALPFFVLRRNKLFSPTERLDILRTLCLYGREFFFQGGFARLQKRDLSLRGVIRGVGATPM